MAYLALDRHVALIILAAAVRARLLNRPALSQRFKQNR
jgi:hypothetical protein